MATDRRRRRRAVGFFISCATLLLIFAIAIPIIITLDPRRVYKLSITVATTETTTTTTTSTSSSSTSSTTSSSSTSTSSSSTSSTTSSTSTTSTTSKTTSTTSSTSSSTSTTSTSTTTSTTSSTTSSTSTTSTTTSSTSSTTSTTSSTTSSTSTTSTTTSSTSSTTSTTSSTSTSTTTTDTTSSTSSSTTTTDTTTSSISNTMSTTTDTSSTTTSTTSSTSSSTSTTTSVTTSTTATTSTSTTTTTTAPCPAGYSRSPGGVCVNLMIDFNNCGSFGHVCSSNYTSCSAGRCSAAPSIHLTNGIAIAAWDGSRTVDDEVVAFNLSLKLTLYNYSTSQIYLSSNGVICLGVCTNTYTNTILPSTAFQGPSAAAFWDDLMIYTNTSQGVYYQIDGVEPNRTTTFEYYTSKYNAANNYYQFQLQFYEYKPNVVKFIYYKISDGGASATVGTQKTANGTMMQYTFDTASSVTNNMTLTFDTGSNTFFRTNGTVI